MVAQYTPTLRSHTWVPVIMSVLTFEEVMLQVSCVYYFAAAGIQ